jgi:PhnB protein
MRAHNRRAPREGTLPITPYLYYEDLPDALKWLAKAFGFKTFGPTMRRKGKLTHAAMKLDEKTVVMMGDPGPKYRNPRRLRQATQSLYVTAKGVDKLFARAKKAGARVLEEPMNTEYGHRRFGVEDPEGHQWYFAEPVKKARKTKGPGPT